MTTPTNLTMALYCDFENVALGVKDARYPKFDITPIIEQLLLKGSIVVKKAYCDWGRYREFRPPMHEASFELIEIPHVRQSGKNSADIRMVVDALDLCYTKPHVDAFVIVSGDSDFSPLVSKLRENAKIVIGVGVKNSTSDLLIANCDEFIFYDDLVRKEADRKKRSKRGSGSDKKTTPAKKVASGEAHPDECMDLVIETLEALIEDRGDSGKIWGSLIKQTLRRRKPGFKESYFGFRSFSDVLEEAADRGLIEIALDERSGGYVCRLLAAK
jgi:uncharacterized LabA/DUF88 family protein